MVLACAGGRYRVHGAGQIVEASLRGRLKHETGDKLVVGDAVSLHTHPDGAVTIESVEQRRSELRRRNPGKTRGERVVVANIDQVVVVGAVARPTWDPYLIDRFTAVAEANRLAVAVVVNKCDLSDGEPVATPYRLAGYPVLLTSVKASQDLDALRARLEGRISVFTGPTGVGKSSLLNALQPGLRLRIGDVSVKSHAGRHTTVAAEMHPFGADGFVVDTPGLRDVGLWGLEPQEVAAAFPEVAAHAGDCRFDNCRHLEEPACAVVGAVENGEIAESRLTSYRRLLAEAQQAARPWAR